METQVKERLTGAVILVTLFVLLVPELLTGGTGPGKAALAPPQGSNAVAAGEPAVRTYSIDLVQGGVRQQDAPSTEADLSAKTLKKDEPGDLDATVEPAKAAAEQVAAQPRPLVSPAGKSGTATALAAAASIPEPMPAKAAPPAAKASPPVDAARPAKSDDKPPAAMTRLAPERSSSSASSGKGWAVQLGSFASRDNAQRLVKQLKGKGYSAFVLAGGGSSGKLYRVRVGPEADRAAAGALEAKLRSAGHKGSVVSQP